MRTKTAAVGVAIAFAISSVLAACGSGGGGGTDGTITLSANLVEKPALDAIIRKFERAHPNITVKPTYATVQERAPLLSTQFQAGTAPDVIGLVGGNAHPAPLFQYAKSGKLVDLSSAPWVARLPSFMKPVVSVNGAVYGGQALVYTTATIYNRPLFERLGLKVPETFDQFLALCGAIRDKAPNVTPLAWPGSIPAVITDVMTMSASSDVYARNPQWNQQRQRGEVKFQTTPGWRNAIERIVRMRDAKCFGPSTVSDTFQQSVAQMAGEKAAMLMGADALLPALRAANPKTEFGMFPLPGRTKDETYIVLDPNENFAVNKKSGNISAAREFVDFLAQPEQSRILAKTVGTVAPQDYARARDAKVSAKALGKDHELFAPHASRFVVNPSNLWPTPEIASEMAQAAQGLFSGQSTVDDVLKAADEAWPG